MVCPIEALSKNPNQMKKLIMPLLVVAALFMSCEEDDPQIEPTACFSYELPSADSPLPVEISFTNCSENATSYLWDFGDGTTSTEFEPTHTFDGELFNVVKLTAYNGDLSHTLVDTIKNWLIVYKPNVYLYPTEEIDLCVTIDFPLGGKIVASIPEYQNGWCVNVQPNGKIDDTYDYLFYESAQPNVWQRTNGWSIAQENLSQFFSENMHAYGFNSNEISDFIEYWIPLLTKSTHYNIYPQNSVKINKVIDLNFSIEPEYTNRLFYVIKGTNNLNSITAPDITPFTKEGFYVNEWGVIVD